MLLQIDILNIVWYVIFFLLIFLYPRIMLTQMITKLEESANRIEGFSAKSRQFIIKKIGKDSKKVEEKIKRFQEFFAIEPSSLDPFGIVKKLDQLSRNVESRFDEFVDEIAKEKLKKEKQMINFGLRAAISVNVIAKLVRHYVEMVKKYKNLQIALILQMQLPMIEEIAKSELRGTEAFINCYPIGDSIGPLVAASMMKKSKYLTKEIVYDRRKIFEKEVFIVKASGPEPRLGRVDEAILKIIKRRKIAKVITIDAGSKFEGEKTGSISEGIGFAMGGSFEREIIENILLPRKIPLESIIVKVGFEEAIMPMKKEIMKSVPLVIEAVEDAIKRTKEKGSILVIGVGNSCGIGNSQKEIKEIEKKINEIEKKYYVKKKKRKGFLEKLGIKI
ncbi:MAG: DUF1512 family protein [Candidatus Aenigmatarchaeota archaeon]|nr:DUF1512 domain-containing protein [Candidatus Aenigmarchaeota archaeon]